MTKTRLVLVICTVAAALVAGAVWWWPAPDRHAGSAATDGAGSTSEAGAGPGAAGGVTVPIVLEDVVVEPPAGGFPVGEPGEQPQPPGEDVADGDQGQDAGEPADPCAAADGRLAVTPDPLALPAGATGGSVTVHNCGTEPVDWTSATKPWVTLAATHGSLAAGGTHELGFTVDDGGLPAGEYTFRIKVSQPGHNVYVDVNGRKGAKEPGLTGKPAGCSAGCVTKAWLTPRHGTPDLNLEVRTSVAARLFVELATQAPKQDDQGRPYFPKAELKFDTNHEPRTRWDTVLTPLRPATGYHIIVVAVDAQGARSTEHGQFTTADPVDDLAAGEAGGCASNCVESAVLTPGGESADHTLSVRAHVPATFAVWLSETDPQTNDAGEPSFPDAPEPAAASQEPATEWDAELELSYSTTYRIILRAVDEQGRSQFKQGRFTTGEQPQAQHTNDILVTFHKIHVSDDGDGSTGRGELRFEFEVDGQQRDEVAAGEQKVQAPAWVDLDRGDRGTGRSVAVHDAPDQLTIRVQAWERDRHDDEFGWQFCNRGNAMFEEVSGRVEFDDCDIDIEWNTAVATIDLHADTGGGALPACYGMADITGDVCAILESSDANPRFAVYVTIDFLD